MNARRILPLVCVALTCAASAAPRVAAPARVVLADHGRAVAAIVIPPGGTPADHRAAEILRDTIATINGARLTITEGEPSPRPSTAQVIIGVRHASLPPALREEAARLKPDGYLVATEGNRLYIASGGHKGSVYGVVHLLETQFGCRHFSPTVALMPPRASVVVSALHDIDNPVNEFRVVNGDFSRDADYRDCSGWTRQTNCSGAGTTSTRSTSFCRPMTTSRRTPSTSPW